MSNLKNILLVDDSSRDRELVIEALADYHISNRIVSLRDGAEALDYLYGRGEFSGLERALPALILLDLKMPKLNGLEVLRQIKTDPRLKAIPVVVMTSSQEDRDLRECYELGVNAYVVKPVHFVEFVEAVKKLGMFWAVLNEPPPGSTTLH